MIPLLAAALCLGAYLNFTSVRSNYIELVSNRIETVARRIAADAHTALSLGLPLGGQTALTRSLNREADADTGISHIDVVGSTGTILFSTRPARQGDPFEGLPDDPLVRDALIATVFGTIEGAVVTYADRAVVNATLSGLARDIIRSAIATFVLGGLGIGLLILLSVRAMGRRVRARSQTSRGQQVPAETAYTIDAVDRAHDRLADRLGGSASAP